MKMKALGNPSRPTKVLLAIELCKGNLEVRLGNGAENIFLAVFFLNLLIS
jgi:hypothetical protein